LRDLKINRFAEMFEMQSNIKELLDKLENAIDLQPVLQYPHLVHAEYVKPTKKNLNRVKSMFEVLEREFKEIEDFISTTMDDLEKLWKYLDVPEEDQIHFSKLTNDRWMCSKLQVELDRCRELKQKKIPEICEKLREEIAEYQIKCKKSNRLRNKLADSNDERELHHLERELESLKEFYAQHEDLLQLVNQRENIEKEKEALKAKQNENLNDRLKNRGGRLLQEANEMKILEKKMLKAETDVSQALKEYYEKTGQTFKVNGEPLLCNLSKIRPVMKNQYSLPDLRLKRAFSSVGNAQ
jgi:predicted  nucleic acid-binding Zn-ribbon protein